MFYRGFSFINRPGFTVYLDSTLWDGIRFTSLDQKDRSSLTKRRRDRQKVCVKVLDRGSQSIGEKKDQETGEGDIVKEV